VQLVERAAVPRGHAAGPDGGRQRLQLRHDAEHAVQPLGIRTRDHGAATWTVLHESRRTQLAQRLAHRRARDTEFGGEMHFLERGTGRAAPGHDLLGEVGGELFRKGRAGNARLARQGGDGHAGSLEQYR
jgi:hypothetical protein